MNRFGCYLSSLSLFAMGLCGPWLPAQHPGEGEGYFRRGDADANGAVDEADADFILWRLTTGGVIGPGFVAVPDLFPCPDAADSNDDGEISVSDAVAILEHVAHGVQLPAPGAGDCGLDPTSDGLSSAGYPAELCALVHCCFADGTCGLTCRDCCLKQGSPVGACLGDSDGNGKDDACEPPPWPGPDPLPYFLRGDASGDGAIDISDAVAILTGLFITGQLPACRDAADANDSGAVDLSDAVYLLSYGFLGGAAPPEPFPGCGLDPTPDGHTCTTVPACQQGGCDCASHRFLGFGVTDVTVAGARGGLDSRITVRFWVQTEILCTAGGGQCTGRIFAEEIYGGRVVWQDDRPVDNECGARAADKVRSFTWSDTIAGVKPGDLAYTVTLRISTQCDPGVPSVARTATLAINGAGLMAGRSDLDGDGRTPDQGDRNDSDPNVW